MPTPFIKLIIVPLASVARIVFPFCAVLLPSVAFADAGAVRVSERHGNRLITVFTDPTPLRSGAVDVSVLVQDAATGEAVLGDAIVIEVAPRGFHSPTARLPATFEAASTKIFQAATFDLGRAGWWEFTVDVQGPQDSARVTFEVDVGEPLPRWQAMWTWFCWPFLVIALFVVFAQS